MKDLLRVADLSSAGLHEALSLSIEAKMVPDRWSTMLEGETIEDTAEVISRFAKAFVIRTSSDDDVRRFAAAATIPVVNALTDRHHPCQALADLMTLREHFGQLEGLRVAYLGDGNNVAHSL